MTRQEAVKKLLAWCAAQVGYHEGANNWNKYADDPLLRQLLGWYPQNQPWCDLWTDEAFLQCFGLQATSEMTYQPIGKGSAACRTSAQFFKDNGAFVQTPEPGDVIFFNYNGNINHQGIVEKVSGGTVYTIEGNSSDSVARRSYSISAKSRIAGYGRPKWEVVADAEDKPVEEETPAEEPVAVKGDYSLEFHVLKYGTGMAGQESLREEVRAVQQLLIAKGFDVGSCGADGEFGGDTEQAVIAYQESKSLKADGEVGPETMSSLLGLIF